MISIILATGSLLKSQPITKLRQEVIGHWSLVIGHWSLVIGHWSLVIGHWSLDISEKESKTLNLSRRKPNFWRCLLVIGQLGQLILSPCSLPPALTAIGYFLFASH
jgi:hypothetical protein